jgi:hypothetical protein
MIARGHRSGERAPRIHAQQGVGTTKVGRVSGRAWAKTESMRRRIAATVLESVSGRNCPSTLWIGLVTRTTTAKASLIMILIVA